MLDGRTQQHLIPPEMLAPLVDATNHLPDPARLRQAFADEGYVLLREVLDRDEVNAARREAFDRLADVEEIGSPTEAGIATGTSRRCELAVDLGHFWKSVSEGPALRRVTHGPRFFGPNPIGAKGGSYGEQKAAQPLGTPWVARQ